MRTRQTQPPPGAGRSRRPYDWGDEDDLRRGPSSERDERPYDPDDYFAHLQDEHGGSGSYVGPTDGSYGGSSLYGPHRGTEERRYVGKGPKNYSRSDERVREDVCEILSDGTVDASDVEVKVDGGVVYLTGTVIDKDMKRRIEDKAEQVRGVEVVENNLRVARESVNRPRH
jgi:hypothetical protein